MSTTMSDGVQTATTTSADGTVIAYHSVGQGPGLVVVGGVLWDGADYLALARALAGEYEVHVMERRGRPGSGPQREGHGIEDECADVLAVASATGSRSVFGHSFGGLVALEAARRDGVFGEIFVYDPGIPLRGRFSTGWFDDYRRRLEQGDRRGLWPGCRSARAPARRRCASSRCGTCA